MEGGPVMKRSLFVISAVLFLLGSGLNAFAFDFGATLDNDTSFTKKAESKFIQENKLMLWVASELGSSYVFNAAVSGSFSTDPDLPLFYADVERLSLTGTFTDFETGPSLFSFEIGRFFQNEFSYRVFAHTLDGIRFDFSYPGSSLQLALGYTGLINKNYASIVLSREDGVSEMDDDELFASPRFVGSLAWEFPEIFARQNLNLAVIFQEDLRNLVVGDVLKEGTEVQDPTRGGSVDTQYVGAGLSGPIMESFYYDLYLYLGTGRMLTFGTDSQSSTGESYQYKRIFSFLTGGSLRYYLPDFYQSTAMVQFLYAGGDKDSEAFLEGNTRGGYSGFVPIAGQPFGLVFTPKASNLIVTELSFSMKPFVYAEGSPLQSLQTVAKITPFFKAADGPMSEAEVNPLEKAGYLGTELAGVANFRPFSDLGMSFSLGMFFPNSGAFAEGMGDPWLMGKFLFSFSF
jgi:hypothetical protein